MFKFSIICPTNTISNFMTHDCIFYNLQHEILAASINDDLLRGVMKIRFVVTLSVLGFLLNMIGTNLRVRGSTLSAEVIKRRP